MPRSAAPALPPAPPLLVVAGAVELPQAASMETVSAPSSAVSGGVVGTVGKRSRFIGRGRLACERKVFGIDMSVP